jgi:hypothetical protein
MSRKLESPMMYVVNSQTTTFFCETQLFSEKPTGMMPFCSDKNKRNDMCKYKSYDEVLAQVIYQLRCYFFQTTQNASPSYHLQRAQTCIAQYTITC